MINSINRFILLLLIAGFSSTSFAQDRPRQRIVKPRISDTVKVNIYADNWFKLYINGKLIAVDSIRFMPHNAISVDILPSFPMTIAVMAKDNADLVTALEYNNTQIGDGGLIIKIGSDVFTNASWKAKTYFHGPIDRNTSDPKVIHTEIPKDWFAIDFDDSEWAQATEHSVEAVRPQRPYHELDFEGAKFIWGEDLELDNTVIFRTRIERPDWKPSWYTGN